MHHCEDVLVAGEKILFFILGPEKGAVRGKTITYQMVSYFYSTSNTKMRRVRCIR